MEAAAAHEILPADTAEPSALRLQGTADVTVAARLLVVAQRHARGSGDVVVDCAALEHIDASIIQVLLALKRTLEASGRSLRLRGVPGRLFGLLLLTGTGQALVDGREPIP